ncbi:MAG: cytochrome c oxidase subunit I [SAR324 cluster bacterium]|uniref:Cytochrome c oxidase subunit 1 n=1 Tax=SAR324 cluster bacterium TaxID=2024889 RepID=A0A2A4T6Y6_9DELT|nr:MAG: cytochrome c oxidase subunit I [SAR324 cluster bacterium]
MTTGSKSIILSWLTTADHKRIGIMYMVTALFFLVIGGGEALLIRMQLFYPNNDLLVGMKFNAAFTMHGTTMIFLVVMPLNAAFFNYLIPLMIGARDVAFPRLNAFTFWIFLLGGILLHVSFFMGQTPATGWFGYANLSTKHFLPDMGADFWGLSVQILGLSTLIASVNFFVTIINMRAKGMSLFRMPLFVWTTLVTQLLIFLSFPVITIALLMLMFDRTFGTNFFNPDMGGNVVLWQHLFWVFGHPEVYILILPPMGIISEVLPTFSKKPLFGYTVVIYSTCALALMGFTVWAHHMFTVGMGNWTNLVFSMATMMIAVPTGVKIFNWLFTMWGGSIRFTSPMLYAMGFILMFTIGGLTGVMHASPPIDAQHQDSYFVVGHFHYVLIGGAIMGIMAGFHYWFPKMFGKMLSEPLAITQFILLTIGLNMTFMSMHFVGLEGMPRRVFTYSAEQGWTFWNQIATYGAFVQGLGFLLFFYNIWRSLRYGEDASADPWDARTLEWSISSPPPEFNFAVEPIIERTDDFWYKKQKIGARAIEQLTGKEQVSVPKGSYYPFLATLALSLIPVGFLIFTQNQDQYSILLISALGGGLLFYFLVKWAFEPLFEE